MLSNVCICAKAEKKGASATEYGFIFGVFELTVFIVAPFYGSRVKLNNHA